MRRRDHHGFTLLELLIALAIFALLAVMAYGGLSKVLATEDILAEQLDRLTEVQRTFTYLEHDILQAVPRPVRSEFGDVQPYLQGRDPLLARGQPLLALTRTGYPNPLGARRSNLLRVDWRLEDDSLYRDTWPVLDRAQDTKPRSRRFCTRVERFGLRYLDSKKKWQTQWPPEGQAAQAVVMPLAVEITLELADWGELKRLVMLGGVTL